MLMYDDSFVAVMTATQDEAAALGARAYGSEHVLLGLLAFDDDLTQQVVRSFPDLTTSAVRAAVRGAVDDAPHLARLGLTAHDPAVGARAEGTAGGVRPRNKHTPELQSALNQASAKWGHLRDTDTLPKERKLTSAILWLACSSPPRARRGCWVRWRLTRTACAQRSCPHSCQQALRSPRGQPSRPSDRSPVLSNGCSDERTWLAEICDSVGTPGRRRR